MSDEITRRDFLRGSGAVIAVGLLAPPWLSSIARADVKRLVGGGGVSDRVLVVCQLTGGNDGLNTVIPVTQKAYYANRPTLAIAEGKALGLTNDLGLHPSLDGLKQLWERKQLAIVNGVGYPHANRSHFRSMEIWQTANPDADEQYGWLGKYLDSVEETKNPNPVLAIGLGNERNLAMSGAKCAVPTFASLADIQSMVGDADADKSLRAIQGMDSADGDKRTVRQATNAALDAMAELKKNLGKYETKSTYAADAFGQGFKQIAHLIAVSPRTRVIYLSVGGFDTHSRQGDSQAKLLKGFGDAVNTFMQEMTAIGKANKVSVMVFSEFGRRVQENASAGTDHGAAAPMFVIGGSIKPGLYGKYPDLGDLERGDLKFNVDFRQVYAGVLDGWMGGDSASLLGRAFDKLPIF